MPIENLILIPTATEKSLVEAALGGLVETDRPEIEGKHGTTECRVCGFGPVAAAALTTEHLLSLQPKRVFLAGIAGGFEGSNNPMAVGSAYTFSTVGVDGVGVGSGAEFQSAVEMGWMPFAGDDSRAPIGDQISLTDPSPGHLLTVCAGSASPTQAQSRRQRYQADAEDMEGYAVAMACQLQNVPLKIIRGISNVAGDRDKANWQIADAMQAAFELLTIEIKTLHKEN